MQQHLTEQLCECRVSLYSYSYFVPIYITLFLELITVVAVY